jgi:hypothetical protein
MNLTAVSRVRLEEAGGRGGLPLPYFSSYEALEGMCTGSLPSLKQSRGNSFSFSRPTSE